VRQASRFSSAAGSGGADRFWTKSGRVGRTNSALTGDFRVDPNAGPALKCGREMPKPSNNNDPDAHENEHSLTTRPSPVSESAP
jgi:hypothetical protein